MRGQGVADSQVVHISNSREIRRVEGGVEALTILGSRGRSLTSCPLPPYTVHWLPATTCHLTCGNTWLSTSKCQVAEPMLEKALSCFRLQTLLSICLSSCLLSATLAPLTLSHPTRHVGIPAAKTKHASSPAHTVNRSEYLSPDEVVNIMPLA